MKTFEEAVVATLSDGALLRANLNSSHMQMMESERWSKEMVGLASTGILMVLKSHDEATMLAAMCTAMHTAFDWGKLVGIEMEKP